MTMTEPTRDWNPRYRLYAKDHGREPDAMLARDDGKWPGGRMTGFMSWIEAAWIAFAAKYGVPTHKRRDVELVVRDAHAVFDSWLIDAVTNTPGALATTARTRDEDR